MDSLGERLKTIRLKYDFTQAQIGEQLGVSGAYISKLENNKDEIPSDTFIYLFCQLFFIRKEWLLKGEYPIQKNSKNIADEIACYLDIDVIKEAAYNLYSKFFEPTAIPKEVLAVKDSIKRDMTLSTMIDYIETLYNVDSDMQGWLKVQFKEAFPKFEEWREKQLRSKAENEVTGE
jgi:transcriptional regulator with XRE-family HTH domain